VYLSVADLPIEKCRAGASSVRSKRPACAGDGDACPRPRQRGEPRRRRPRDTYACRARKAWSASVQCCRGATARAGESGVAGRMVLERPRRATGEYSARERARHSRPVSTQSGQGSDPIRPCSIASALRMESHQFFDVSKRPLSGWKALLLRLRSRCIASRPRFKGG
jgi:hypothetical protein